MRVIFFGTPALAVPSLATLTQIATVVGVVTQPDRPSGRGLQVHSPPVKATALERGLEVFQPVKVRTGELASWVRERKPDLALTLAYGRILPNDVLQAPRLGCLNLHASLLPKYRGAAPIQWAIIRGETETGISLMQMAEGLDSGPVFSRHVLPIGREETAGELMERLAELAALVTKEDVPRVYRGELASEAQDEAVVTLAPPIEREHGRVDWSLASEQIVNLVRGLSPKPGAHTTASGKNLRLFRARRSVAPFKLALSEVGIDDGRVWIGCEGGTVEVLSAQLEGKRELSARDLVNGRTLTHGMRLGG